MSRRAKLVSDGEMRVVKLAVKGLTDKEISAHLGLSTATVRTNWVRLRRKLDVVNRAQAIARINDMNVDSQVQDLQTRTRVLQAALDANDIGVMEWCEDGRVVLDASACRHLGMAEGGATLHENDLLQLFELVDRKRVIAWRAKVASGEASPILVPIRGVQLRFLASHLPRLSANATFGGLLCTCTQVEESASASFHLVLPN